VPRRRSDFKPLPVASHPRQVSRAPAGRWQPAFALEPLDGGFRCCLLLKPCDVADNFRGCALSHGFKDAIFGDTREGAAQSLAEKLKSLPVISGQPDIAALGDPALVAKQWAVELHLKPEDDLKQFLDYLEDMQASAQPQS
jgi:hypothetical protein